MKPVWVPADSILQKKIWQRFSNLAKIYFYFGQLLKMYFGLFLHFFERATSRQFFSARLSPGKFVFVALASFEGVWWVSASADVDEKCVGAQLLLPRWVTRVISGVSSRDKGEEKIDEK